MHFLCASGEDDCIMCKSLRPNTEHKEKSAEPASCKLCAIVLDEQEIRYMQSDHGIEMDFMIRNMIAVGIHYDLGIVMAGGIRKRLIGKALGSGQHAGAIKVSGG